jgi:hypothetical protein
MLPWHTASRPPSLKLVIEMPVAASSTMLDEITAPSMANSEYSATSPRPVQLLPVIWMPAPELLRTAVNRQSDTRLLLTITLPARYTLTPLPFWPSPPERASIFSIRLPVMMVPSLCLSGCHTRMPLSPMPVTRLPSISSPRAPIEKMAVDTQVSTVVPEMVPEQLVRLMPLPPELVTRQFADDEVAHRRGLDQRTGLWAQLAVEHQPVEPYARGAARADHRLGGRLHQPGLAGHPGQAQGLELMVMPDAMYRPGSSSR